jgi:lipopolysaccharide assembly outer membrane protein LptD (OstA)
MKTLIFTIVLSALCLGLAAAQSNTATNPNGGNAKAKPAAAQPAADKPDDKDDRVFIEHADTMRYDPATKTYHLRGNVVFANRDMKLYCDQADYREDADTAKAVGHLRVTDPNSVITGDLIEADFGKEIAVITGHVTIITQKKANKTEPGQAAGSLEKPGKNGAPAAGGGNGNTPSGEASAAKPKQEGEGPEHLEDYWENKTTITCERVEYYYNDDVKKMIATPRVKAIQEDKTVWADTAIFEDIPRLVTLTGDVVLITEKGDEIRCRKAVVSVDEDWIQAEGIKGVTLRKDKKKGEESQPAPAPAGTPAPTPTPTPAPAPAKPEGGA